MPKNRKTGYSLLICKFPAEMGKPKRVNEDPPGSPGSIGRAGEKEKRAEEEGRASKSIYRSVLILIKGNIKDNVKEEGARKRRNRGKKTKENSALFTEKSKSGPTDCLRKCSPLFSFLRRSSLVVMVASFTRPAIMREAATEMSEEIHQMWF
ncbi:hypothetical protein NPIL_684371 [Nephila pilipes]|uniref:Uncharacterized protein n=1 Tax=Nephila pilipes TaxID=299642 RepID=A0A8X6TM78_NEPPI|nr:hypothetical protein NPIL_684371 [Nephila pilipes]